MNVKEAKVELARVVRAYRCKPYEFWESRIGRGPIALQVTSDTGSEYQVEIESFWDGQAGGSIRVLLSIDDGGWRAFCPLSKTLIIPKSRTQVSRNAQTEIGGI